MPVGESSRKVQYDLRPCKQVERRILVDAFQRLMQDGFEIQDYQYTGMGSIHFVDFILLHRYLGIRRMVSVEMNKALKNSVEFNRPYDCINTVPGRIGDQIPILSRDIKHIVWLDYDSIIEESFLVDTMTAVQVLSPGSILLVTVDVEPPGKPAEKAAIEAWRAYYEDQAGAFLEEGMEVSEFARMRLPRLNSEILFAAIRQGVQARTEVEFVPMFHFVYADGHKMLTVGGMIAGDAEKRRINGGSLRECEYFRGDFNAPPFEICVPVVTRRERFLLDQHMPHADLSWTPTEFELSLDEVSAYRQIYRYLPAYAELAF